MFSRPSQFSLYFYGKRRRVVWYQLNKILGESTASILGTFTKLRKAATSFVMSIRPSVRVEQLGSHWTDFREI
jgi:hypothetical protein